MSDNTKTGKQKRGYRRGSEALAYDLRVRISAQTAAELGKLAEQEGTTRAQVARNILERELSKNEK